VHQAAKTNRFNNAVHHWVVSSSPTRRANRIINFLLAFLGLLYVYDPDLWEILWDQAGIGITGLCCSFCALRQFFDCASFGLSPNMRIVRDHLLRDVTGQVSNDLVSDAAFGKIGNEGMAGVVEATFDICPSADVSPGCL